MKDFIIRKYKILENEAAKSNHSIFSLFLNKLFSKFIQNILLIVDIIILFFLSPLIILIILASKLNNKKNNVAFFLGLEHVINKTVIRSNILNKNNIEVFFFALDNSQKVESKINCFKYSKSITINFLFLLFITFQKKPVYFEIYSEGQISNQILALLLAKALSIYTVIIERGMLYQYDKNDFSAITKQKIKLYFRLADLILYRETYMPEIFKKMNISESKTIYDFNRVPINPLETIEKNNVILFLNGFKEWRNIEILIEAMPLVLQKNSNVFFQFVGAKNIEQVEYYKNEIIKNKIPESIFDIQLWTNNPGIYYKDAKIFVLPADLIFCNFSLLEAMERGVVPIVSDVIDADKIVKHKVNGLLCERNINSVANCINTILEDKSTYEYYAKNCRNFIIENYNDNNRMDIILDTIKTKTCINN